MGFRSTHQRLVQINQPPLFTWLCLKFPAEQCSLSSIVTVRNTALHPLKYQKSTFYSLCQIMAKWGSSQEAAHGPLKDFVETGSLLSKAQSSRPKVRAPSADGFCFLRVRKEATSSQVQTLLNLKKPRTSQDSNPRFESRDESVSKHEPWFIKHFLRRGNKTIHDGILQWITREKDDQLIHVWNPWQQQKGVCKGIKTRENDIAANSQRTAVVEIFRFCDSGVGHLQWIDPTQIKEIHNCIPQRLASPFGLHLCGAE